MEIDARNKRVLIISDTHIPYSHIDYINFLRALKSHFKPEIVIHIGDELDYHAISFHDSDQELLSAGKELDKSIIEIQEGLHKLFPKMYLLESNHGSLVYRKMKHHGIPVRVLKPIHELYETPLWSWHHEIILKTNRGDVYLCHGKSGVYGKLAKEMGMSTVQGHYHGKAEVTWHRTAMRDHFNMFVGCLVDESSLAMAYGKNNIPKPILASGALDDNGMPYVIRMNLNSSGRWTGEL
jgi:predicted phosphodiesterase